VGDPRCTKIAGAYRTDTAPIMPNMRIFVIAVVVLLSPAIAHASKDCMTKAEARKVYRTSYLYWHGKGRCWDVASRHKRVGAVRRHRVDASHKAKPEPEEKVEVVDSRPVPPERTLTPDDLRKWGTAWRRCRHRQLRRSWIAGPMKNYRSAGPSRRRSKKPQ
jgi:hypothetical protein